MKRKQSGSKIMMRLIKLVKPLAFFMVLAVILGVTGFLCAIQITVLGSMTLLTAAGINGGLAIKTGCICIIIFAVLRGFLHYGEQACNHYIAFKLLAIIRDKVFKSLRRLTPAKLEGKDKGKIEESGTHSELMSLNKKYKLMYSTQAELEKYAKEEA